MCGCVRAATPLCACTGHGTGQHACRGLNAPLHLGSRTLLEALRCSGCDHCVCKAVSPGEQPGPGQPHARLHACMHAYGRYGKAPAVRPTLWGELSVAGPQSCCGCYSLGCDGAMVQCGVEAGAPSGGGFRVPSSHGSFGRQASTSFAWKLEHIEYNCSGRAQLALVRALPERGPYRCTGCTGATLQPSQTTSAPINAAAATCLALAHTHPLSPSHALSASRQKRSVSDDGAQAAARAGAGRWARYWMPAMWSMMRR